WRPVSPSGPLADEPELALVTWNVLADFPDQGPLDPDRLPRVVEAIEGWSFDVLALQEATPALLGPLLALAARRGWFVSEPPDAPHLTPHGLLLLSRWPFELAEHRFSPHKSVLIGTWTFASRALRVACLHLTSNRVVDAPAERQQQLEWVL